jgi:hypothetical protein
MTNESLKFGVSKRGKNAPETTSGVEHGLNAERNREAIKVHVQGAQFTMHLVYFTLIQ